MSERTETGRNTAAKTGSAAALGSEGIPRLVLRYSASTLAALLLNSVYNLTDTLFVSWGVGNDAMGGVSIAFPFVILQGAVAAAVGGGAASIVSRRLGEGNKAAAGEVTLNAMLTFYATALLTSALGLLFLDSMLQVMGVTGELYPFSRQYLFIILLGNIFSTGFSSIIRAEGKMLYGLLIWVIPISLNILLDAVFILGLGMGVGGSALATVLSQFVSFCMSMLFFARFSAQVFKGARPRLARVWEVVTMGVPSLVQMGSLSVASVVLNNVLRGAGGTLAVNTYAYLSKLVTFAIVPFTAVSQGLAPIAGYNYGLGQGRRVRQALGFCLALDMGWAVAAFVLMAAAPQLLLGIFTNDAAILGLGVPALRAIAFSLFFMPLPMVIGATFQAVGKKGWALAAYAAILVFLVSAVLVLPGVMGISGVWWAYVAANACACAAAALSLPALGRQLETTAH